MTCTPPSPGADWRRDRPFLSRCAAEFRALKKQGCPAFSTPGSRQNGEPAITTKVRRLIVKFDPQTVAQAKAFVNALRAGKRARVPALRFSQWQPFLSVVNAETGYAADADCGLAVSVYPALGLA
jgi:hypothetical protein